MLNNYDLETIELEIQSRAKEARQDALIEMESDIKFPEIVKVFHQVYEKMHN